MQQYIYNHGLLNEYDTKKRLYHPIFPRSKNSLFAVRMCVCVFLRKKNWKLLMILFSVFLNFFYLMIRKDDAINGLSETEIYAMNFFFYRHFWNCIYHWLDATRQRPEYVKKQLIPNDVCLSSDEIFCFCLRFPGVFPMTIFLFTYCHNKLILYFFSVFRRSQ